MVINGRTRGCKPGALHLLFAASMLTPVPAMAQPASASDQQQPAGAAETPAPAAPAEAPSQSAMVNLVRALVARGALTADVGDELIRQAEAEAVQARSIASGDLPAAPSGAIRVPYIPESVRAQIKDELRAEVMQQAKTYSWASPDTAAPEWTRRVTIHGDVRVRSQSELYSRTNADDIIDFATLNALSPYGIDDPRLLLPILNSRNDRWNQMRIRSRLGVDVRVTDGVTAGFAIATGDNAGPISTNASLAGGFFKRDLWLDKAWVRLAAGDWLGVTAGRFDNPFSSSDLLYDADLNFDGIAVEFDSGAMLGRDWKLELRGGAFPFDYGSSNYPTFAFDKPKTPQRYLISGEVMASGTVSNVDVSLAAGYHVFDGFQGDLSEPCQVEVESFCSTDHLQPPFLTKGNTLSPLRQIVTINPNAELPQLLGYTFDYRVLDLNATVSVPLTDKMVVRLAGSYVKNLGFDEADICRNGLAGRPYNNNEPGSGTYCDPNDPAEFAGGDTGYRVEALLGWPNPSRAGEWNVFAGYRYLESDAVLDALTDSDFHLGGTNAKGYFIGGNYMVRKGVTVGGRWMSANEISGPPLAIDVLQIDLGVRF